MYSQNLLKYATKKEARLASGYPESTALNGSIDSTEGGKWALRQAFKSYEKELARIQKAMASKDLNKEQYQVLVTAMDKVQKQIQLLSGGATENIGVKAAAIVFGDMK